MREMAAARQYKHGLAGSVEYGVWQGIIKRCYNERTKQFSDYGGRGIQVATEWRSDFMAFLAHVGKRPGPEYSLDRFPNNDGNYEPGNVRWATRKEQNYNKRNNIRLCLDGVVQTLGEWAVDRSIPYKTLVDRINSQKLPFRMALEDLGQKPRATDGTFQSRRARDLHLPASNQH